MAIFIFALDSGIDFSINYVLYKCARRAIAYVYLIPIDPTLKSSPKRRKTEVSRWRLPVLHRENQLSDMNLMDQHGNTRLHIAARDGCVHDVERLIERGARVVAVRNNDGITPYDLADSAGHFLLSCGKTSGAEKIGQKWLDCGFDGQCIHYGWFIKH